MAVQLGSGEYTFEVNENWAKVPEEITLGDCAAVGVDRQNRVYAFNRGEHPVAVFDAEGNLLRTWGERVFHRPHGVHMGPDDTIWLTDDGDHTVRKCALDGKVLMTLGIPGEPKPFMSGEPFHRCTHTALSPHGDLYVSDGYGNARIHKYTPDGKLLMSWGEPGTDPGQFNIPHNICCDRDGWVYVADRENHRVQVFDGNGKFETQWNNLHRPNGMCMATGRDPLFYIGEGGPSGEINKDWPNIGPRVSIHTVERQGAGPARQNAYRARPRPVHLAARHRRRRARQHLCRRIVGPDLAALLQGAAAQASARHPQARQDRRLTPALSGASAAGACRSRSGRLSSSENPVPVSAPSSENSVCWGCRGNAASRG